MKKESLSQPAPPYSDEASRRQAQRLAITEIPTRGQVMKWIEETLDFASDDIVKFRYAAHTEFFFCRVLNLIAVMKPYFDKSMAQMPNILVGHTACTIVFCKPACYHAPMKSDLRISIKDYHRNKNLRWRKSCCVKA